MKKAGFGVRISGLLERYTQPKDISARFELEDYFIRRDLEFGWEMKEEGYPVFWDGGVSPKKNPAISPDFPLRQFLFGDEQIAGFDNEKPVVL